MPSTARGGERPPETKNATLAIDLSCDSFSLYRLVFRAARATLSFSPLRVAVTNLTAAVGLGTVEGSYVATFAEKPSVHAIDLVARDVHINHVIKDLTGRESAFGTANARVSGTLRADRIDEIWSNNAIAIEADVGAGRIERNRFIAGVYEKILKQPPPYEYFNSLSLRGRIRNYRVYIDCIDIRGEDKEYRLSGGLYNIRNNMFMSRTNVFLLSDAFRDRYLVNPLFLALPKAEKPGWYRIGPFRIETNGAIAWFD
jgi:hypothetical protein